MPHPRAEDWLNLLGNKHRRQIIRLCSIRPLYPQKIAEILGLTPAAVIKHLQELEKNNIVVKKTEPRAEGGRDIQYYYVPFRPRFNFNLANNDLVEIDIVDESDQEVPPTTSRKKLIDLDSISSEDGKEIQEKIKTFIGLEQERNEVTEKLQKLHVKQRTFFSTLRSMNPQHQMLLKIIRFLLDRYGFDMPFTENDIVTGLGVDEESAHEIIQVLSNVLNIISMIPSPDSSAPPTWILNSFIDKNKREYS